MEIIIKPQKDDADLYRVALLAWGNGSVKCALGKGGVSANKKEGDGATPLGSFPIRSIYYRPDAYSDIETKIKHNPITPESGWCDDPKSPDYNRFVTHPYDFSAEKMWRDDGLYDLVVVLGHNDDPPKPGLGSAIFMHIARPDYAPTEGCIALKRTDMETLLKFLSPEDVITIKPPA